MNQNLSNAIKLMRYPFSLFLMPIFWFALSASSKVTTWRTLLVFFIVHLLLYPSSNGYNCWFDKDEGSIGGIKNPPPTNPVLIRLVYLSDLLVILFSLLINVPFCALMVIYTLVSKAYSHPATRLKKRPIIGTLVVVLFQGSFMYLAMQFGFGFPNPQLFATDNLINALVSTLFLLGSYPLTQIYQHDEDRKRGDITLSILLGLKGTFIFAGLAFGLASILLGLNLYQDGILLPLVYLAGMAPVLYLFTKWMLKVVHSPGEANFENTMQMNKVSSLCLSAVFLVIWLLK